MGALGRYLLQVAPPISSEFERLTLENCALLSLYLFFFFFFASPSFINRSIDGLASQQYGRPFIILRLSSPAAEPPAQLQMILMNLGQ